MQGNAKWLTTISPKYAAFPEINIRVIGQKVCVTNPNKLENL